MNCVNISRFGMCKSADIFCLRRFQPLFLTCQQITGKLKTG